MDTVALGGVPPGVYVDPILKRQKIEDMPRDEFLAIAISDLNQTGPLFAGSAAKRDVAASILGVALPKLERRDQDDIARAKKYAMEQSIKYVLMKQTLAHQQQQAKSLQRHQALVLMCRVYIGSISFELREDTIRQAFAPFGYVTRMEFGKTGPIKTINMSWDPVAQKHKGFAFVEYDLPEAAQLALEQMNGVMIGGRNIKCGRDTRIKFSHMDQVIDDLMDEAKAYHRIYVASIHADLTEEDIKSVFEAFGKIKACKLAPGPSPGKHRGYGFIEYETAQGSAEAIASMNLFDLGGQYLRVGKAITPPNALQANPGQSQMPTAAAVAAAAATAKIQAMEAVTSTAAAMGLSKNEDQAMVPTNSTIGVPPPVPSSSIGLGLSPVLGVAPPSLGLVAPGAASVPVLMSPPHHTSQLTGLSPSLGFSNSLPIPSLPPPGVAVIPMIPVVTASVSTPPPVYSAIQQMPLPPPPVVPQHTFSMEPQMSIPPPALLNDVKIAKPAVNLFPPPESYGTPLQTTSNISLPKPMAMSSLPLKPGDIALPPNVNREELVKQLTEDNENNMSLSAQENMSIKGQSARHLVMQKLMRNERSPVIVLKNMVTREDVDDALRDEITDECNNFGVVEKVIIYEEKQSEDAEAPVIVKIFVEFTQPQEADLAKSSLHGRFFGGRRVICESYEMDLYKIGDLSG